MKYLRVGKYIISLDNIHGILHSFPTDKQIKDGCLPFYNVVITYIAGVTASLDFETVGDSEIAFDKIAQALGAN